MRILKVTFENLNSLAGRWEIDFMDPEFERSPLFVITGPTGSGKTTILDAISLALYGQTARLGSCSQSSNEVMTRGTAYCSADVVFEASGKCYLSHWYQRRARNNIDGNLQQVERRIYHLGQQDNDQAICSNINACNEKIVELTGLSFEQFSQSIMLSQGQFTRFLKANADERASLLEKMTGTEIYSKISMKVYELYKEKEKTKDELNQKSETLKPTPTEDADRLENEQWLMRADEELKGIDEQIGKLKEQKQWLEACQKQQQEAEVLAREEAEHERQESAFAPSRVRLERGILAQKHETALQELQRVQNDLTVSQDNLEKAEKLVSTLQKNVETAKTKANAAAEALVHAEKVNEDAQPGIDAMIEADAQIKSIAEQVSAQQARVKEGECALKDAQKQAEMDARKVQQMEEERQKCRVWLEEHQKDSTLAEAYTGIVAFSDALMRSSRAVKNAEKTLSASKQAQQKNLQAFQNAQDKYQKSLENKAKADQAYQTEETRYHALLNEKTLEALDEELKSLIQKETELRFAQKLEDQRRCLVEGKACPLCGSLHHPWAEGIPQNENELSQKIKILEERINSIKKSEKTLNNLKEVRSNAENQRLQCQGEVDATRVHVESIAKQIETQEEAVSELSKVCEADKLAFTDAIRAYEPNYTIQPNLGILERLKARMDDYKSHLDHDRKWESEMAQAKENAGKSGVAYKTKKDALEKITVELNSLQREEKTKREERIQRYGNEKPDVLRRRLAEDVKTHKFAKEKADDFVLATQKAFEDNQQHIVRYKDEINKFSDNMTDRRVKLLSACQEDHFESIERMQSAILDHNTRKMLEDTRDRLNKEKDTLHFRRCENDKKKEALSANPLTDKSLEEVEEVLKTKNMLHDEIQQTYGSKKEAIRNYDEKRKQWQIAVEAEEAFLPEFKRWESLNLKIGSSDGKKFKVFVQNLTLKFLINYANDYLKKLDTRYKLIPADYMDAKIADSEKPDLVATAEASAALVVTPSEAALTEPAPKPKRRGRPKKESSPVQENKPATETQSKAKGESYRQLLNIKLIDSEMDDIRPTDNLSGGETFLVSLALALGLAAMASRNIRIDTLYIDEGFGTLDNDTLSRTLHALCEINGRGRQIGIISHVAALQDAITTKIVVKKNGQGGHSILEGAGVRHPS